MGEYLIPNAKSIDEIIDEFPAQQGTSWTLQPEGVLVSMDNKTNQEIAAIYEGFVPQAKRPNEWPLLPEELRPHAAHIVTFGQVTQAEIDAVFPPGSVANRMAHVVRDLCRGMIVLVDPRLED